MPRRSEARNSATFSERTREIGAILASARERINCTQEECAKASGTTRRRYGLIERGEVPPNAVELEALVRFLGISPRVMWKDLLNVNDNKGERPVDLEGDVKGDIQEVERQSSESATDLRSSQIHRENFQSPPTSRLTRPLVSREINTFSNLLGHLMAKIEDSLIKSGAKPGTDYTFRDLSGWAMPLVQIEWKAGRVNLEKPQSDTNQERETS